MSRATQPLRPYADRRPRELARIHVAKKHLGLDRDTYEAILSRVAGVRSAADLDDAGRAAVIAELERLGAPPPPGRKRRPKNLDREPMLRKIESQLAHLGADWGYADALARRMCKVERVAWLRTVSELAAVIAALDARIKARAKAETQAAP